MILRADRSDTGTGPFVVASKQKSLSEEILLQKQRRFPATDVAHVAVATARPRRRSQLDWAAIQLDRCG